MKVALAAAGAGVLVASLIAAYVLLVAPGGGAGVAVIRGVTITDEEWRSSLENFDWTVECIGEHVARHDDRDMAQYLAVLQSFPRESVVFGGLVLATVMQSEADARGLVPSEMDVAAAAATGRRMLEPLLAGESAPIGLTCGIEAVRRGIAAVGEDRYWGEIFPEGHRRGIALGSLCQIEGGLPPYCGAYGFRLARAATLRLSASLSAVVSLTEVMAYIDAYEQLVIAHSDRS